MISIAPKNGESQIDELNDSLNVFKKTQNTRDIIFIAIIALFWIPISVALFGNMGLEICGGWFGLTVIYFLLTTSFYYFIQSKTHLRSQIKQLSAEIDRQNELIRIEKERIATEKEEIAIALLQKFRLDIEARKSEMLAIENEIKYKRKWREEFDNFPNKLERNWKLDQSDHNEIRRISEDIRRSHLEYSKWNRINLYSNLGRGVFWPFGYTNYRWLRWRIESMKSWEPPDYGSHTYTDHGKDDLYDDDNEKNDKKRLSELPINESVYDQKLDNIDAIQEPQHTLIQTSSQSHGNKRNHSFRPERQQASLFDDISLTEKPIAVVPKQKERLPKRRIIKISDNLRRRVDEQKLKIGKLGELAVMEHERLRLQDKTENIIREIKHVSLTNDAAGYDILSWNGKEEIYIEVKTTVGDFWSNLFFTENERQTMKDLKEKFYLYRICNFNIDKGEGQLFIYAGKELITDTFEFNSKLYLLSEKSH